MPINQNETPEIGSPVEMMKMFRAFQVSRILLTAYELEVFTIIDNSPLSAKEIAGRINAEEKGTDRLMNVLTALGYTIKENGLFSNTTLVSKFLVKGKPEYWSGLGHSIYLWKTWSNLTDAVLSKGAAFGSQINDRGQDWLRNFINAMHSRATGIVVDVAKMIDFSGVNKILDIGGGSGIFASTFVRLNPGTTAVVFDLPNVIPITQEFIDKENLDSRVTTRTGNFNTDDIGSGYDMIFLCAIIHGNSEEENESLYKKCFKALNPGGKIVIIDWAMSEDRTQPLGGAIFAINMLVNTEGGDTYTKSEIINGLTGASFKDIEIKDVKDGNSMITGWKR